MTTEEIIKGNKMIAEFMGIGKTVEGALMYFKPDTESYWIFPNELKYHSSWDWLMPVCKKFDCLSDNKTIEWSKEYSTLCDNIDDAVTNYDIDLAFNVICKGIQWYNDNLKNLK